jgi:hypothetical protein
MDFGGGGRRPSPVAGVLVTPATEEVQGWRCSWGPAAGILPLSIPFSPSVDLQPASGEGISFRIARLSVAVSLWAADFFDVPK